MKKHENYHILHLGSHVASSKVESEKGCFGEWKDGEWFREVYLLELFFFLGLFSNFCDKETCRECLGDALRKL
jgi:hypothetical protein